MFYMNPKSADKTLSASAQHAQNADGCMHRNALVRRQGFRHKDICCTSRSNAIGKNTAAAADAQKDERLVMRMTIFYNDCLQGTLCCQMAMGWWLAATMWISVTLS